MPVALQEMIDRFGGWPRVGLLLVGLGAVGVLTAFGRWAMAPEWVVVSQGVDEVVEATRTLSERGVEYQLARGGAAVEVKASDLAESRVYLAEAGVGAQSGGFELFDQDNWGITEFGERVKYRRALESELSRTISDLEGVRSARVHLALEPRSFLRQAASKNEASIILHLRRGFDLSPEAVSGIGALVSGSVEHMVSADVTIVDQTGRVLSTESSFGIGLSNQQLAIQQEMEGNLERKAVGILSDLVGPGNVTVSVSADLDFSQIDRIIEDVDPDRQVVLMEESSEVIPGAADQGASQVERSTRYEVTKTRETMSRHGVQVNRLAVSVMVNDKQIADGDAISVVARTDEELAQIEALVRNAVGLSPDRGDAITVVSMAFQPVENPIIEEGFDIMGLVSLLLKPLVGLVGLALAFVMALRLMKNFMEMAPPAPPVQIAAEGQIALAGAAGGMAGLGEGVGEEFKTVTRRPQQDERVAIVDPQMTARVVRAWLRE